MMHLFTKKENPENDMPGEVPATEDTGAVVMPDAENVEAPAVETVDEAVSDAGAPAGAAGEDESETPSESNPGVSRPAESALAARGESTVEPRMETLSEAALKDIHDRALRGEVIEL